MKDKKSSFWILLLFFGVFTLAGLISNQTSQDSGSGEMSLSMGGMMKKHHVSGLRPADLLKPIVEDHGMEDMAGHHELTPLMGSLAFLSTTTVLIFLPLLIGGAVLLLVLWI